MKTRNEKRQRLEIKCETTKNVKIEWYLPSQLKYRLPSVFVVSLLVGGGVFIRRRVIAIVIRVRESRIF